jgi:hypothetical protein
VNSFINRADQYAWLADAVTKTLVFCKANAIPIRFGEANRPSILAKIYSTGINLWNRGVQLVWPKVGIADSKHLYSLAIDIWIYDPAHPKEILWSDPRYALIGKFWESLGGTWGGRFTKPDIYHCEVAGSVL